MISWFVVSLVWHGTVWDNISIWTLSERNVIIVIALFPMNFFIILDIRLKLSFVNKAIITLISGSEPIDALCISWSIIIIASIFVLTAQWLAVIPICHNLVILLSLLHFLSFLRKWLHTNPLLFLSGQ